MSKNIITPTRHVSSADKKASLARKKVIRAQKALKIPREGRHKHRQYFIVGSDGSLQVTPY